MARSDIQSQPYDVEECHVDASLQDNDTKKTPRTADGVVIIAIAKSNNVE